MSKIKTWEELEDSCELYYETCAKTGEPINEGFCWHNGNVYSEEAHIIELLNECEDDDGKPFKDYPSDKAKLRTSHEQEFYYWTTYYNCFGEDDRFVYEGVYYENYDDYVERQKDFFEL
jgi:hypothetical protein